MSTPEQTDMAVGTPASVDQTPPEQTPALATEAGETAAPATPPEAPQPTEREARMAELVAKQREARDAEVAAAQQTAVETPPVVEPAAPPAPPAAEPTAPPFIEKDGQRFVKIKVYGQEREVNEHELIRLAQKGEAADEKLRQAADLQRRTVEMHQRMQQASEQAAAALPAEVSDAEIEQIVDGIYNGDTSKAAATLKKILSGRQQTTPVVSEELIERKVHESLRQVAAATEQANRHRELLEAANAFTQEFPDLAGDPNLALFVDSKTAVIAHENPTLPPMEIVRRAAREVQEIVKPKATPASARVIAKQNLPPPVVGAQTAVSLGNKPPPPKTPADVLNDMRRARGQATI